LNLLGVRLGLDYHYAHSREIFTEITSQFNAFEGVSYDRMDEEQGVQLPLNEQKVEQK
jgi:NADH-quinone oxidoreductase subunit G